MIDVDIEGPPNWYLGNDEWKHRIPMSVYLSIELHSCKLSIQEYSIKIR